MKITLLVATLFVSMSQLLHAQPLIEAKAGYFFFTNAKMRKIYDQGGLDLQIAGTYPIHKQNLSIYGSVEYLQKAGHSLGGHQKSRIWAWPISLGLRAEASVTHFMKYYLTLGPRYFFVTTRNNSSFVPRHTHANGLGCFANTGFLFITDCWTIDFFGEWSYKRLHFHSSKHGTYGETTPVGGLTFGGGLGYSF